MAVNNQPLFGGIPIVNVKNVSIAKTSLSEIASPVDATDLRLVFTAGANGGFIDSVDYQAIGTGTPGATIMNVWVTDEANANARIVKSLAVPAGSGISTINPGISGSLVFAYMNLAYGQNVYISFTVLAANVTYNVTSFGGQYSAQL